MPILHGISLSCNFCYTEHITEVFVTCAHSLYAIRILMSYDLASDSYTTRMHILQEGYNSITAALCSLSEVWLATDLARIEAAG